MRKGLSRMLCLACLLLGLASWSPWPTVAATAASSSTSLSPSDWLINAEPLGQDVFEADDRFTAEMPDGPVELAQLTEVPLHFTRTDIVSLSVEQSDGSSVYDNLPADDHNENDRVGTGTLKVVRSNGRTKVVEIVPLQVGSISFEFTAVFADGGFAREKYSVNVAPASKGLKKFFLNSALPSLLIVLEPDDTDPHQELVPQLWYDGLEYPLTLKTCEGIRLTVEQPDDNPIVRVDGDGTVHGLRPGKAVITGDLDGVQDHVTVQVDDKDHTPAGYISPYPK
jgi:hypothetical protein